ncbi:MAG: YggS family pyridoxal phosphate-dependent enzyme [Rhodospirillaceae bacterium]|nr:YggS family pyridoxal phosphate-dependent enzyme [Rhodospirillaceae bacterium]
MVTEETNITENLDATRAAIAAAAKAAGRDPDGVTLVCVSKTHPAERIRTVIEAGERQFGENKVQEAEAKWPALKQQFPHVRLHLIGPLQSNKVKHAVALFDVIETVDRPKLARALAGEMEKTGRRPECYIQVNTGEEDQKAGVLPLDADAFISLCRDELGLPVVGLMCIPPVDEEPALHFTLLKQIATRNGLGLLSMGMSGDFETAVRCGATAVRVGSKIFGARE